MFMKYYYCLFFIVINYGVFAQTSIKVDSTHLGLAFATIYNCSSFSGTYTNSDGSFKINANKGDTLIFSCVGYYSDTIIFEGTLKQDILLQRKIYDIGEVTHRIHVNSKVKEYGFRKEKDQTTFYSHIGSEWVVFIKNDEPGNKKVLKSVVLKTKAKHGKNIAYRIHIYDKDSITSLPGKELLALPVFNSKTHKGKRYDINQYMPMPKAGVFVGIEWISYLNKKGHNSKNSDDIALSVPLTFGVKKTYSYYRSNFYDNTWKLSEKNHPLSQILNKSNPPNLAASIVVEEYIFK